MNSKILLPFDEVPRSVEVVGQVYQHYSDTSLLGQHGKATQQRTHPN